MTDICHWSFVLCHLRLLLDHVAHLRLQVHHRAREAGKVLIVLFGNLNAVPLAELHDDVEEVHAVELELLAERLVIDDSREVLVRCNIGQNIEDFLAKFGRSHYESRVNLLMITTELIPSIPKELFRIYSVRFNRRGSPTISAVSAQSGSSSSTLIVAWQ